MLVVSRTDVDTTTRSSSNSFCWDCFSVFAIGIVFLSAVTIQTFVITGFIIGFFIYPHVLGVWFIVLGTLVMLGTLAIGIYSPVQIIHVSYYHPFVKMIRILVQLVILGWIGYGMYLLDAHGSDLLNSTHQMFVEISIPFIFYGTLFLVILENCMYEYHDRMKIFRPNTV